MAPSLLLFAGAKIGVFCHSCKFLRIFLVKIARVSEICSIFAPANRDLAQLVAHYVRDVGVAGSSPVIPNPDQAVESMLLSTAFFVSCSSVCLVWRLCRVRLAVREAYTAMLACGGAACERP